MDIAFVSSVVYPFVNGGVQKRIHEIGSRLVDRGHDVTVYARHFWDGPSELSHDGMVLKAVAAERDLYVGDRRSIVEAIEYAAAVIPPLVKEARSHDLLVVSAFPYFPVLSATVVSELTDMPLVTTWHEVWGDYWDSYLGRLAPCGKLVERIAASVPQHPVSVSEMTAGKLAEIAVNRSEIDLVPNGIDVDHIRSVRPASPGYDVLFVGRLIPEKNVNILIQAFENVAAGRDATLGIVGDGPRAESLRGRIANSQVSDRIDFVGDFEAHDDVLSQLKSADIFAAPSIREGFGITYLEAMAAGCTVIAADHPNSAASEVVGEAGFVVKPNVESISAVLAAGLDGRVPNKNPVRAAERYDWDVVTEKAERVFRQALADDAETGAC